LGGGWTERAGNWKINNNEAALAAQQSAAVATVGVGQADVTIALSTKNNYESGNPGLTDLVVFWELDDLTDSHGANDLTNVNGVTFVAGKVGNAADFEFDSVQRLSIIDNADLSIGDEDFYWGGWIKPESAATAFRGIFSKDGGAGLREYSLSFGETGGVNRVAAFISANGSTGTNLIYTNLALALATFYWVEMWYDSVGDLWYCNVNNGTAMSAAHVGGSNDGGTAFEIGRFFGANTRCFDGLVDEVVFYKRVLTADERTWLYNAGAGRAYSELASSDPLADTGIVARWSDNNNYWLVSHNVEDQEFRIWEKNVGTYTKRASAAVALAGGTYYDIEAELDAQTITATLDGGNQISYGSAALNETETIHGMQLQRANADDRNNDFLVTT